MTKQKLSYTEAQKELESILQELENDQEINMDLISKKVKRATELIEGCKKQLLELDQDLEKVLEQLN